MFRFGEEDSLAEERAYQGYAGEIDAQRPGGLCVASSANAMNSCQSEDAQRQHMQPPPPFVANVLAQQGADADGDAEVQADDAERHPLRAIVARKRDEYFVQAEVSEGIDKNGQHMHAQENCAEQSQKVV